MDRALAEVRAELARFPDPVPPEAQARFVALRRREALLASRRAAVGAVVGDELLRTLSGAELATPAAPAPPPPTPASAR